MKFKVTGINLERDHSEMDYSDGPTDDKDTPKKKMVRLESTQDEWCTMSVSMADIPGAEVGDIIQVTFGRRNQGNAG